MNSVHLPNDAQWLPSWFLRTPPEIGHDHVLQILRYTIPSHQHLLWCFIRNHRCSSWFTFFPCQNSPPVFLSFSTCGNAAQIPQRVGWLVADLPERRCQRIVSRRRASNGPDGIRKQRPAANILFCQEEACETFGNEGRPGVTSGQ